MLAHRPKVGQHPPGRKYNGVGSVATLVPARRVSQLTILNETPLLDDRTRGTAAGYLDDFFDQIGSPPQEAEFMKICLC
jgi:hypothetical protein